MKEEEIKIIDGEKAKKHEEEKKLIYQRREKYRNKAFAFSLQMVFIIGIPVVIAVILGKKLDVAQNSGYLFTLIFLGSALIISWTIIIIKYLQLSREIKKTEEEIKTGKIKISAKGGSASGGKNKN